VVCLYGTVTGVTVTPGRSLCTVGQRIEICGIERYGIVKFEKEHHGRPARIMRQSQKMADFVYRNQEHLVFGQLCNGIKGDPALESRACSGNWARAAMRRDQKARAFRPPAESSNPQSPPRAIRDPEFRSRSPLPLRIAGREPCWRSRFSRRDPHVPVSANRDGDCREGNSRSSLAGLPARCRRLANRRR
jgi:hypothetical protein